MKKDLAGLATHSVKVEYLSEEKEFREKLYFFEAEPKGNLTVCDLRLYVPPQKSLRGFERRKSSCAFINCWLAPQIEEGLQALEKELFGLSFRWRIRINLSQSVTLLWDKTLQPVLILGRFLGFWLSCSILGFSSRGKGFESRRFYIRDHLSILYRMVYNRWKHLFNSKSAFRACYR